MGLLAVTLSAIVVLSYLFYKPPAAARSTSQEYGSMITYNVMQACMHTIIIPQEGILIGEHCLLLTVLEKRKTKKA